MNVITILSDTFRWDHLGYNGNDWIETPRLDQLASESAIFNNCYTENLPTLPMRTAAFTGRFTFPWRGWEDMRPEDLRMSWVLWQNRICAALISDSMPMFTMSNLYAAKWDYVQFVRGHAGAVITDEHVQSEPDMDRYFLKDRVVNHKDIAGHLKARRCWNKEEDHAVAKDIHEAIKWVDSYDSPQPFMLWLDIFDPHEPWSPPEEYWRKYYPDYSGQILPVCPDANHPDFSITEEEIKCLHALYAGKCTMVDKWIGKFLDHLKEKGILEDTMILFTSDHGAPLGPGKWGHGLYRKCANWPYEELAHTPLLVRSPDGAGAGKQFDTFVQSCDLTGTILDAFGVGIPEKMHTKSVLPVIKGETDTVRDFAVSCHSERSVKGCSRSIRTDEWTYIYWPHGKKPAPPAEGLIFPCDELYSRKSDPEELNNVIEDNRPLANELALKLRWFENELQMGGE